MRNWRRTFAGCSSLLALLFAAACGGAAAEPQAILSGHDAWARPADSGGTTAMYFILSNTGTAPDTVVGVASAEAEATEMHVSMQQGGMMRMSPVRALRVPAEDSVSFRPLGAHVMLLRLHRKLVAGDTVTATLSFESGQQLEVRAGVRQP